MSKKNHRSPVDFDEASSSSDSDDDDSSQASRSEEQRQQLDGDEEEPRRRRAQRGDDDQKKMTTASVSSSRMEAYNSDDDSDSSDDVNSASSDNSEGSGDDKEEKARRRKNDDISDDDSEEEGDDSEDDDDDEEDLLPIHERINKREQKGLEMRVIRERKTAALKMAGQRLANMKKKRKKEEEKNNSKGDGDDKKRYKKKKKSKHAPTEVSSKRSDFFKRGASSLNERGLGVDIGAHRYKPLDPRTSNLHGHYNEEQFETNYAFLEDIRNQEISQLKKRIHARKVTGRKGTALRKKLGGVVGGSIEEDQEKLMALKQQKAEFERRKIGRSAKHAVKKKLEGEVAEGKRGVYFLKRKEKRQLEQEARLEEIRKRRGSKAVEKAVEKRRKKNKSRDANQFV